MSADKESIMNYIKKPHYKQQSEPLTLRDILHMIAAQTGSNPKLSGKSYSTSCPAHDDKHASLSIAEGDSGKILLFCHSGCLVDEICASIDITVKDLFPKNMREYYHD